MVSPLPAHCRPGMPNPRNADNPSTSNAFGPKPTAPQLTYLRALAAQTGTSFAYPRTMAQALREISRLKALAARRDHHLERDLARREAHDVRDALDGLPGQHAAIRNDEITGYGSSARWT